MPRTCLAQPLAPEAGLAALRHFLETFTSQRRRAPALDKSPSAAVVAPHPAIFELLSEDTQILIFGARPYLYSAAPRPATRCLHLLRRIRPEALLQLRVTLRPSIGNEPRMSRPCVQSLARCLQCPYALAFSACLHVYAVAL